MTIFHVIKYPISDMPQPSELAALPKEVFEPWAESLKKVVDKNTPTTPIWAAMYIRAKAFNRLTGEAHRTKYMEDLRRRLLEYEE